VNSYFTKDFEDEALDARYKDLKVYCLGYLLSASTPNVQSFMGVFGVW